MSETTVSTRIGERGRNEPRAAREDVVRLLETGIADPWLRMDAPLITRLADEMTAAAQLPRASRLERHANDFLGRAIQQRWDRIQVLHREFEDFRKTISRTLDAPERRRIVLDYARQLGATDAQLRGDRKAFERWFGEDAVTDRYRRAVAGQEREIAFCLQRMAASAVRLIGAVGPTVGHAELWRQLDLERRASPLLAYDGDTRVQTEAFRALAAALRAMPRQACEGLIGPSTLQYVYRAALDASRPTWIQCEALDLLRRLSPVEMTTALERRIGRPVEGDDLFVRRRAVRILVEECESDSRLEAVLERVPEDPSDAVRQALAESLAGRGGRLAPGLLVRLAHADPSPQVRAAAVLASTTLLADPEQVAERARLIAAVLAGDPDAFVVRVALEVCGRCAELLRGDPARLDAWRAPVEPVVRAMARGHERDDLRTWATQARERMWLAAHPVAGAMFPAVMESIAATPPGAAVRLPRELSGLDDETVGRMLAVATQRDFGLQVSRRGRRMIARRGDRFGFRMWRALHEFRHPSPDKRQAFRHTIGRIYTGRMLVPSAILAEVAATKVPGEPLHVAREGGWRPYLPLPDQLLSSLDQGWPTRPVRIFTTDGVTEVLPPRGILGRLVARARLTWSFARLAKLRNWEPESRTDPSAYARAAGRLGFRLRFAPWDAPGEERAPPAVARFFPAAVAVPVGDFTQRFQAYFFSVFENSLFQLLVFTVAGTAAFLARHLWANRQMHRARASLPLVIGGWGTRGKSGVERLKAAVFNALGYGITSKTTGCEAMFLHAHPYGPLREMFLFRPYDKATIWEQLDLARLAQRMGSDVFLWECMALQPAFVRLLQRQWMRDDYATLTNAFPDHEDIQGPAGIDIPQVMAEFVPRAGRLVTSEESMLPILTAAARSLGVPVRTCGWLEAGLIPRDVLARFPYDEHPNNIALVLALAEELGIDRDFALKEMADRVVPDLGVLKSFPSARLASRRLEFANGMSANERFGCLSNWQRLGFDRIDPETAPDTIVSTVVNNRADRVARSQVFAGILVNDISADLHFLIGSNLHGLMGYIREAWDAHASALTLWPESTQAAAPEQILAAHARRLRVPSSEAQVRARLRAMVDGSGLGDWWHRIEPVWNRAEELAKQLEATRSEHAAQIAEHHAKTVRALEQYEELMRRASTAGTTPDAALDRAVREWLGAWFLAKLIVVEDFHASGNQIVALIAERTPPGLRNRIMGIQNIKGTGLDFVYRWLAWDVVWRACEDIRADDPARMRRGLTRLAGYRDYGLLAEDHVKETVTLARRLSSAQTEGLQAELTLVQSELESALREVRAELTNRRTPGWRERLLNAVEAFLDAGQAIRRRKTANRIYQDLAVMRIGHERAALELQALNRQQKGGWLAQKVSEIRVAASAAGTTEFTAGPRAKA